MSEREFNEIFAERLRSYLKAYEMTQLELSKRLNVGTTSVYNWCNGVKTPRMDKVDAMCNIFNCKRSDLMEEKKEKTESTPTTKIPVLGRVAAGIPLEAIEEILDYEEIPDSIARHGDYFGLRIQGDSMTPGILDGDVVIVRKQSSADSGDIVIAAINGKDATCKRLRRYKDGIELIPSNPSYQAKSFSNQEIESLPVTIFGKVVELRRKF